MKRLFRTSKTGTVDPLPPPPPPNPPSTHVPNGQVPPPGKKPMGNAIVNENHHGHHHPVQQSRPRQGSVTPFPIDMGRETPPPQAVSTPLHANAKSHKKEKGMNTAPTLMEIQQMQIQAEAIERDQRRDQWLSSQQRPSKEGQFLPPRPSGRGYENQQSPDDWSLVSNGGPGGGASLGGTEFSNASTPTITQPPLFLPPGARPPSPQIRPSTPNRQFPQGSPGDHYDPYSDPYVQSTPRGGRDRGYSSASGSMRGSDHESSNHGHQHKTSTGSQQMPVPKPSQPMGTRSPLHHYTTPISPEQQSYPPTQLPYPTNNHLSNVLDGISAIRIEGPSPEIEMPKEHGKDKEKKKFWGMGMNMNMNWGEKRDKKHNLDRPSMDEPRRSTEWQRSEDKTASSHGHVSTEEDSHRGRSLGLHIGGFLKEPQNPAQVDNVTAAIQILCAHPDPPFASIYEVCDRINHSSSPESVGKEAAHALRKQFKHGSEVERRSAANLWLLMMRNVTAKGFRSSATSKKFVAALEPILLAPAGKALVSAQTHRMITDIAADVTYNFGGEKGSESLVELWRKVKLPQESEHGVPLPVESQQLNPENFYASNRVHGSFDSQGLPSMPSSQADSRRPSSPGHLGSYDHRVPPLPPRSHPPLHTGGPGYHNLPNHGDDIRRLVDECTAAKEAARVLAEALVYTRPDELDDKPIIKEFYRKCFLAHESLTNQIDWAQAEAAQSRERLIMDASARGIDETPGMTMEEQALGTLFEAHGALAEVLKQHDDLERLAVDEQEMREVRERSKKDVRMDRNQGQHDAQGNWLAPGAPELGSSSRSPSPAPRARLPPSDDSFASPRQADATLPMPRPIPSGGRSRTPSPDRFPRIAGSPGRANSPLGQSVLKARGPRPLPNPFSRTHNASTQSLSSVPRENGTDPSRSAAGSTNDHTSHSAHLDDEDASQPVRPSRKALGKRRVIEDPDNRFDPDDMFAEPKKDSSASSDESVTADEVFFAKPVKYAYDAYQEKLDNEVAQQRSRANSWVGGGSNQVVVNRESRAPIEAR